MVKTIPVQKEDCKYSSNDECNLRAHMIVHTDTHRYSCMHCRQAFKHHTQMSRYMLTIKYAILKSDILCQNIDNRDWNIHDIPKH